MIVITGGGSGIGRALALELAQRGEKVLIVGRRQKELEKTAADSDLISICCADVSLDEGRLQVLQALKHTEVIKGLVHNAGVIEPIKPLAEITEAAWQHTMATNLNAPLFLTQLLLEKLKPGRVLHVGSAAAYFPVSAWAAYCVSKAGLAMLTRCWQLELGYEQTAFSSVMPGIVDTTMQAQVRSAKEMDAEKLNFFHQLAAKHKLITSETVAQFLAWLLLTIPAEEYASHEWDIYDTSHHPSWLTAPYQVPALEPV